MAGATFPAGSAFWLVPGLQKRAARSAAIRPTDLYPKKLARWRPQEQAKKPAQTVGKHWQEFPGAMLRVSLVPGPDDPQPFLAIQLRFWADSMLQVSLEV